MGVLRGWRTIAAVLGFLITGFLGVVGTLDLTPVVALFVKDPPLLGAAMVGIAALFGYLRYLTTTPLFSPRAAVAQSVDEAPPDLKRDVEAGV